MGNIVETLREALVELAAARIRADVSANAVRAARYAWEQAHSELLASAEADRRAAAEWEAQVRARAVEAIVATGQKRPAPGVEVRTVQDVQITDRAAALGWARASGVAYIPEQIDERALALAVTKADLTVPGVERTTSYKTVIATDLYGAFTKAAAAAATVETA